MRVNFQNIQVNAEQLHAELIAAGVSLRALISPLPPFSLNGDTFTIEVAADGTNEALVRQVVLAHIPAPEPTPAQIKKRQARKLIESDDSPESVRLRAVIRVLYVSLVEVRAWCNQMRQQLQAAGMPTPPRLENRSWEAAQQAVLNQIDNEIPDPVEVNP